MYGRGLEKGPVQLPDARRGHPQVYSAWDQCVRNRGALTPLLVLRKNRGETLAVVSLDHFLTLQAAPEAPLPEAPLPEAPTELASDALAQLTTALAQAREAAERLGVKLH